MLIRSLTLLVIFLLVINDTITAQTEERENAADPETETNVLSKLPFNLSGALDLYFQGSSIGAPPPTSFTENVDGFTLGMANLIFSKDWKRTGFVADLAWGPRAETANGYQGSILSAIKQAYIYYSPADWVTLTAGNFGTFVGYEVIDATGNINYSTSYLFSNGPFYHTGLKADFALSDKFGAMLGIFDDTDTKFDFTKGKHLGAQLSYASDNFEVYLNYLTGKDVEGDTLLPDVQGHQFDIVATFQATEAFGLGLNASHRVFDPAEGNSQSWSGIALYANYAFADWFTLGWRGEYFNDPDGIVLEMTDSSVFQTTLSGNFYIDGLTIIPEIRLDAGSKDIFLDEDGKPQSSNVTFVLAAVYGF